MNATPPPPASPDNQGTSTRPYLIRALHDWCTDNGFTPYLAVHVDGTVQVPMEYVKNHEIVLNVGFEAPSSLKLGNDFIEFKARFGGVAREIIVPVDHVVAIYARENGQGMAFPMPQADTDGAATGTAAPAAEAPAPRGGRCLRLASVDDDRDATVPGTAEEGAAAAPGAAEADAPGDDEPPPTPRPALKRVK
ncbi:MAG: ClpXP protease specificity-enhancing factor [Burkholderiales bacterium]|nr:ClpXP protease specificity-enhancing factor [Burkholderiales bacterium]